MRRHSLSTKATASSTLLTFSLLTNGTQHIVKLHFAETYFSKLNDRTSNVTINGAQMLTNPDISPQRERSTGHASKLSAPSRTPLVKSRSSSSPWSTMLR
ncbi:MAG: malectin domain-containing carbohydrate-binding protein [Janthinobacterium lividum]